MKPLYKIGEIVTVNFDPELRIIITRIVEQPKGHDTNFLYFGNCSTKWGEHGEIQMAQENISLPRI